MECFWEDNQRSYQRWGGNHSGKLLRSVRWEAAEIWPSRSKQKEEGDESKMGNLGEQHNPGWMLLLGHLCPSRCPSSLFLCWWRGQSGEGQVLWCGNQIFKRGWSFSSLGENYVSCELVLTTYASMQYCHLPHRWCQRGTRSANKSCLHSWEPLFSRKYIALNSLS